MSSRLHRLFHNCYYYFLHKLLIISGKECMINIDECESNPCMQGSECKDGINGFTCECQAGLTGKYCEINIDDCQVA